VGFRIVYQFHYAHIFDVGFKAVDTSHRETWLPSAILEFTYMLIPSTLVPR